jgi:hypothetical protein
MSLIDALEDLLLAEQRLIRDGRLHELERTSVLKEQLATKLAGAAQHPEDELRRLRDIASVNAQLLEAAGRGLKSALRQIEDIRQAATPATYTRDGARRALSHRTSRLEQKL